MIKNVVVTGYNGSGASALKCLLCEYNNCKSISNYEHIVFYTPNGLFDLENKLLLRNNQSRSDEALKSFENEMYKLWSNDFNWCGGYKTMFGDEFKNNYETYIKELTQFEINGSWSYDLIKTKYSFGKIIKDSIKTLINKRVDNFGKIIVKNGDNKIYCSLVNQEEFYKHSKKFVDNYLNMFNKGNNTFIFDHLLKPYDIDLVDKYFNGDFRMIIVERDVRDIFLYGKYMMPRKNGSYSKYPKDPKKFVEFWKRLKQIEKNKGNNKKVLRIYFEDLVYDYNNTINKIEKFLELNTNDHTRKNLFDLEHAKESTKLYLKNEDWKKEIKIIEEELKDYCYNK